MLSEEKEFSAEQRLMHALNNDLGIIVGSCDVLDCIVRDSEAAKCVARIRSVVRKIADEIGARQCGHSSNIG